MKKKVTVDEAFSLIASKKQVRESEILPLSDAIGRRLTDDLYSPIALPPFDNSAVDGYALGSLATKFKVVATIGAGETYASALGPNEACRIMTGAKVPKGARAVVMQEFANTKGSSIQLKKMPCANEHIRWAGEDIGKGGLAALKGSRIGAAQVGFWSALGVDFVRVDRPPTVAIVSTGSELIDPGQTLPEGHVYYCTGPMLKAQSELAGARVLSVQKLKDDPEEIVRGLKDALAADIVITIGGMADGAFDYGRSTLSDIGVEPVFFEGQWRPGKPLFFGTLGEKLFFGLPGNPVAAFVMFRLFVEAAMFGGMPDWRYGSIVGTLPKPNDKTQFLRARHTKLGLELLPGQGSHQLCNLSQADYIVRIDPNHKSNAHAYVRVEP